MEDEPQDKNVNKTKTKATIAAAGFASAQITIFYLFWIMFFGEVIRWSLPSGKLYRPIRDSFLIPFSDIFTVGHHWIGKIITGTLIIIAIYYIAKNLKRYTKISEEKMIRNGYALIVAFWVYAGATLLYFIGHLNKFWFF